MLGFAPLGGVALGEYTIDTPDLANVYMASGPGKTKWRFKKPTLEKEREVEPGLQK